MTDPRRYLLRMLMFLAIVGTVAGLLYAPLEEAFRRNEALNGVILGALVLGIAHSFQQILRLVPEYKWIEGVKQSGKPGGRRARKPKLLATIHAMMVGQKQDSHLSALSLRSVLDGVAGRLDEGRDISRYLIGLLVFLGLLGTFWGLLQTIGAVGLVVGTIDITGADFEAMMRQLKDGLEAPLTGMSTAFSSSLFGLGGSLILGFLDLLLGQAMGRFFNELEDWLATFARFDDANPLEGAGNASPLAGGMSEEAARALVHLGNSIASGEENRQRVLEQLSNVNVTLGALNEAITDDRRLREQLAQLNANILQLSSDLQDDRASQSAAVTAELRTLASAISGLVEDKGKASKRSGREK